MPRRKQKRFAFLKNFDAQSREFVKEGLNRAAEVTKRRVRTVIRDNDKVATGSLIDSIQHRINTTGRRGSVLTIFSSDPGASWISEGRRPDPSGSGKMPPVDALRAWAQAVGFPDDRKSLFALARSIQKEGIPAFPFFDEAFRDAKELTKLSIVARIREAKKRAARAAQGASSS